MCTCTLAGVLLLTHGELVAYELLALGASQSVGPVL